jgi:hypothetical protein
MTTKLERSSLHADLTATNELLEKSPPEDVLGRIGLTSRRDEIVQAIAALDARPNSRASTLVQFSGTPVIGSVGIKSDFAGTALKNYQDVVAKVLALQQSGNLGERGVVPHRDAATLHLTNIVHGSFGFILEELSGAAQEEFLESALKSAVEETARLVSLFADEDEDRFASALVNTDRRVFDGVAEFISFISQNGATFRLVSSNIDRTFNTALMQVAGERARLTHMSEGERELVGELRGVLPEAHRFEFRTAEGEVIQGAVSRQISSDRLQAMYLEFMDQPVRAVMQVRRIERAGRELRQSYTLIATRLEVPQGQPG